jgi:hypothetical protein
MKVKMKSPSEAILAYLRAKDQNRPYLMRRAFTEAASLKSGVDSITEVLVRRFAQSFENVFTFCLGDPPKDDARSFSCKWMVGMSERESGAVRVGCGRYDWLFQTDESCLVRELTITIEFMQTLPPRTLDPIMDWLSSLPYPWCPVTTAIASAPKVEGLEGILDYISQKK